MINADFLSRCYFVPCKYCGNPITFVRVGDRSIPIDANLSPHELSCKRMRRERNRRTRARRYMREQNDF